PDGMGRRIAGSGRGDRNLLRRNVNATHCNRRSARHAHALCALSRGDLSLAAAASGRACECRRALERCLPRRLAQGVFVCGALLAVSTWLGALPRHKALSARRRRTDVELDGKLASALVDPTDGPELVLEKKDREQRLRHGLARLSPQHSEVIDLAYYHGKSI